MNYDISAAGAKYRGNTLPQASAKTEDNLPDLGTFV